MRFAEPLLEGRLLRRYKRFLADLELADGRVVVAHVPNSGRMTACVGDRWRACVSRATNPGRKLKYTLEMTHNGRCWIGVNTGHANTVAYEAVAAGRIPELAGCTDLRREVPYADHSRIDILARDGGRDCYIEVKNVSLVTADGAYRFPDAVTERGRKHLDALAAMVAAGQRAVMLYVIQRSDGDVFRPARAVDPAYADRLAAVHAAGVEVLAWRAAVSPEGIELAEAVPVSIV